MFRQRFLVVFLLTVLLFACSSPAFADEAHDWGPWIVDKEPTCQEPGHKYRICDRFPATPHAEEATIPKLDHHVYNTKTKAATCLTPGEKISTCIYCGHQEVTTTSAALGHDWGAWVVVREATTDAAGLEERVCLRDASHKETRAIAKIEEEPTAADEPEDSVETAVDLPNSVGLADDPSESSGGLNVFDVIFPLGTVSAAGTFGFLMLSDLRVMQWDRRRKAAFLAKSKGGAK